MEQSLFGGEGDWVILNSTLSRFRLPGQRKLGQKRTVKIAFYNRWRKEYNHFEPIAPGIAGRLCLKPVEYAGFL